MYGTSHGATFLLWEHDMKKIKKYLYLDVFGFDDTKYYLLWR